MNQERKGRFMVHLYTDVPVTGAPNATQKPISMCMCIIIILILVLIFIIIFIIFILLLLFSFFFHLPWQLAHSITRSIGDSWGLLLSFNGCIFSLSEHLWNSKFERPKKWRFFIIIIIFFSFLFNYYYYFYYYYYYYYFF